MEIIVLCGGPSSEYDVSLSTAEGILKNIDEKYKVKVLFMSRDYKSVLFEPEGSRNTFPKPVNELADDLSKISKDSVILIAMHGEFGEDGVVQSLLDSIGLKYTGSNASSSILCMDKYASYQALKRVKDIEIPEIYSIEKILSGKIKSLNFL